MAVSDVLSALAQTWGNQLGGTFLAPGSTFSLGALAASFAVAVIVLMRGKRRRPVRVAVVARALFPRRLWRSASGRADLILFVGGILFAGVAIGWAVIAASDVQAALLAWAGATPFARWPLAAAITVTTVVLFLAYELAYWLDHWLKHRVPLLWQFHKVHHQAESLSLVTNGRVHPVDTIVFYNIVAVVTGAAGAALAWVSGGAVGPWAIGGTNALVMLTAVAITHLQHSHLWVRFGPRGSHWLLGAAHHQIHHSSDPEHFDRNFGNCLALCDRAFGTFFLPPARRPALCFGVADGTRAPHGLYALTLAPFANALATLRPRRAVAAVALPLTLAGCIGGRDDDRRPAPPRAPLQSDRATQQCLSGLLEDGVRFRALPDQQFGGGCSATGAVQLLDIGVPTTNLGAMRCGLAGKFAAWIRYGAQPAARQILGSELVRVESMGTYACRNVVGRGGVPRLSGHALANAADVAAFVLADGRRITVKAGWNGADPLVREFLTVVRRSACRRFGTVLSPDYNAAHADHLHLEDDAAGFCR